MFPIFFRTPCLVTTLLLAAPLLLRADVPATAERLQYVRPENVPAATTRVDGKASRGDNRLPEKLRSWVLSPDHNGITVQEHPSIFWYVNEAAQGVHYKISIVKDGDADPIYEKTFDAGKDIGIQRLNLRDISRGLELDTTYQVIIAFIADLNPSSSDRVSSAVIQRIPASEKLVSRLLTRPTPAQRAVVYARLGVWYDALAAISDEIAANPNNKQLHAMRADMLKQGNLPEAAAFDVQLSK